MTLDEYRRNVVDQVGCPLESCGAPAGSPCVKYVGAASSVDLDYVHDDRSHAFQELSSWAALRKLIEDTAASGIGEMYDLPWWWTDKVGYLLDDVEENLKGMVP